jgi:aminoglycoside phosphotransferase (APT) family kinase protein
LAQQAASALLVTFELLAAKAGDLVATALPLWANTPPAPVHGDLRLENIINTWGTAVLLDWELFGLGDPALDVATFLHLSQAELGEDGEAEWLEAYLARFDQPRLVQRIDVYRRLLPFQSVCFLLGGLRDYLHSSQAESEPAANLSFLAETLRATLLQTAKMLQVDVIDFDNAIQTLFHA